MLALLVLAVAPLGPAPLPGSKGVIGWVRLRSGAPAPRERVSVTCSGVRRAVVTSAEGFFHLDDVAPGSCSLEVRGHAREVQVVEGRATIVELSAYDGAAAGERVATPSPRPSVPARLRFEVSLPKSTFMRGERIALSGRFINDGPTRVVLVGVVDASELGWRAPRYLATVENEAGRVMVSEVWGARCGNVDGLTDGDVLDLGPGQSGDPFSHVLADGFTVLPGLPPGRYRVRLQYDYAPTKPQPIGECSRHRGGHPKVPAEGPSVVVGLVSNDVELEIVEAPIDARVPTEVTPTTFSLPRWKLKGRVTMPSGRPRPGLDVLARGHAGRSKTDADGRFVFDVLPGRYEVTVYMGAGETRAVDIGSNDATVDLDDPGFGRLCIDTAGGRADMMRLLPGEHALPDRGGESQRFSPYHFGGDSEDRLRCLRHVHQGPHTLFVGRVADDGRQVLWVAREVIDIAEGSDQTVQVKWLEVPLVVSP
ncbi:MAG: carboxypeptidase regulatory-like domain-containing protein [Myxococcaceae bacterium]|nr:carboxypeptidase regulatory-like domain-containing protein [Myxococcaceae bacterium]